MPKGRIYNRTKGSAFPNGLVLVVRAGITNTKGVYVATPKELEVQFGKEVYYDISSSSPFRITAEPKNKAIKAANYFPEAGKGIPKGTDVYVIASNKDSGEVSFNKSAD
jgi:hypothetical protein